MCSRDNCVKIIIVAQVVRHRLNTQNSVLYDAFFKSNMHLTLKSIK